MSCLRIMSCGYRRGDLDWPSTFQCMDWERHVQQNSFPISTAVVTISSSLTPQEEDDISTYPRAFSLARNFLYLEGSSVGVEIG